LDLAKHVDTYPPLSYSGHFWAHHIWATAFSLDLLHIVEEFMHIHFLHWLEVLNLVKEMNILVRILRTIVKWCDVNSLCYMFIIFQAD
jgi:hypothetical protein